jgi:hypothetical protein
VIKLARGASRRGFDDSAGVYHVVDSASEIPAQYRKQAGRIRGAVQRADASPAPQSAQAAWPAGQKTASGQPAMTEAQAIKAMDEEMRQRLVQPQAQPQTDPNWNSLRENFIEYNNRIANQAGAPNAPPPTFDAKAKCIDNSGASVPCSETGMQGHQGEKDR